MKAKFYNKRPEKPFEKRGSGYFRSQAKAAEYIEENAHKWADPWIQLVREDADGFEVVAEYRNHASRGWVTPMQAMGLASG